MATIKISCETQDAKIMYTTDDSEPTESSNLYSDVFEVDSPVTIKARAFKEGYEPSDIATKTYTPITVPMALPDGSVLFYDRGSQYGEYHIDDTGYPVRNDGASDDGSVTSNNWRYFICDEMNLANGAIHEWGPINTSENLRGTSIGVGLSNTNSMISKYIGSSYWWSFIKTKIDSTNLNWFMPSKDELNLLYEEKDIINSLTGGTFPENNWYWSSSEYGGNHVWSQYFSSGLQNTDMKDNSRYCRLIRRI